MTEPPGEDLDLCSDGERDEGLDASGHGASGMQLQMLLGIEDCMESGPVLDPYTCIAKKNRKYASECTEAGVHRHYQGWPSYVRACEGSLGQPWCRIHLQEVRAF